MKFRIPRIAALTVSALLTTAGVLPLPSAQAQDAPPKPTTTFPTQTKTTDDVTVTLVSARWMPLSQVRFTERRPGIAPPPAFFAIDFRVDVGGALAVPNPRRPATGMIVEAITPDGVRLRGGSVGPRPVRDGIQTRVWNGIYGIDPRWKEVRLEFTWIDAKAPSGADGHFSENVEWANIPLPTEADKPLTLNLLQTTAKGTRVLLESALIQDRRNKPGDKSLYVIGRWLPPENAPDLCAEIKLSRGTSRERRPGLEYDTGEPTQDRTHHTGVESGKSTGLRDETAGYFTAYASAPPAAAKTMALRLEIDSRAPSLVQPQWRKQFGFTVPLANLPLPAEENAAAAPAPDMKPIAEAALGEATLFLLPPRFKPQDGYKYRWQAEVLLRAPQPQTTERQWVATGVKWFPDPRGPITTTGMGGTSRAWREDGTVLKANEQLWHVSPFFENDKPPGDAPKLTFESQWQEVQRSRFALDFKNLPVPQPGQILTPDTIFPVGALGQFVVRKIGYFDEKNTLSPRVASRYKMFQPPYGLAVVLQYVPADGAAPRLWGPGLHGRAWDFGKATARDSSGRSLVRVCYEPDGSNGPSADELDPATPVLGTPWGQFNQAAATKNGYFLTIYLLPPAAGAATFDLHLDATHEKILRAQTVTWPDVALPPPVVAPVTAPAVPAVPAVP